LKIQKFNDLKIKKFEDSNIQRTVGVRGLMNYFMFLPDTTGTGSSNISKFICTFISDPLFAA